jgi:hypothetical protein
MAFQHSINNIHTEYDNIYIDNSSLKYKYYSNYLPYHIRAIFYKYGYPTMDYLPLNCTKIHLLYTAIASIHLYNTPPLITRVLDLRSFTCALDVTQSVAEITTCTLNMHGLSRSDQDNIILAIGAHYYYNVVANGNDLIFTHNVENLITIH